MNYAQEQNMQINFNNLILKKRPFYFNIFIKTIIIIISISILLVYWKKKCDKDLQAFIISILVYLILEIILNIYFYINNVPNRNRNNNILNNLLHLYRIVLLIFCSIKAYTYREDCKLNSPELLHLLTSLLYMEWSLRTIYFIILCLPVSLQNKIIKMIYVEQLNTHTNTQLNTHTNTQINIQINEHIDRKMNNTDKLILKQCDRKENDYTCVICLVNFEIGNNITVLPCNHDFHQTCINKWLVVNNTCPLCRIELV